MTGEEARRAEELEKKIDELRQAGKYREAQVPAKQILTIRMRVQGAAHWETQDARLLLRFLEKVAALPAEAQKELDQAEKREGEAAGFYKRGLYRDAVPQLRRVLEIRQRHLGPDHLEVGRIVNRLGLYLAMSGSTREAELLYRRALAIKLKLLGEDHPDTATSYNNVAANLDDQGKYAEAEPLYRRALAIKLKLLGEDHLDTAISYNNWATNLYAQGKHAESEQQCRRALAINRNVQGEDHLGTARSYNNLAATLDVQGKLTESEVLYRRALAIRLKMLGEDHPDTAISYNNLGYNLYAQGRYFEAEPMYHRALAILQKVLGEEQDDTATTYNNLAANLNAQGKYAEAEPLYGRALAIRRKALGEDHPAMATIYDNVAHNLWIQGKYAEAEPQFRRALAISLKALGKEHPDTAISYNNVASNLANQGKYDEAEPFYLQALAIRLKTLGEEHPDTALSCNNLAYNLHDQGKIAEAERQFRRALAIYLKLLGEDHRRTAYAYNNLAGNLASQGKFAQAVPCWAHAAKGFDIARLRSSKTGVERASFVGGYDPRPAEAACQARLGQPLLGWQSLEAGLARGLLDDLSARLMPDLTPAERQRQQGLNATLDRLDRQVTAWFQAKLHTDADRARFRELARERQAAQAELARLAATLGARQVYDRKSIQEQLAPDAAWIAWLDRKAERKAVDPNGEHWACILRQEGEPVWVRLPGSGLRGAWIEDDDDLLERFRRAISAPPGQFREDMGALTCQVAAQRLAPLEAALRATGSLPAVKHLLVCPVWWLAGVPVEALTDQYTISYVPSGTLFARLQEQRRAKGPAGESATLFALGDPVFRERPTDKEEPLPDSGVLITALVPRGNADRSGIKPDDVLLAYGDKKLSGPADLKPTAPEGTEEVSVQVWRQGQTLQRKLRPGKLGVMIAKQPAPVALREKHQAASALRASTGPYYPRLPGTRQEVQAIARLFDQPLVLLDAAASAQRLDALAQKHELRRFRYLHFATHGELNDRVALQSALILSSEPQPAITTLTSVISPESDGRLNAAQMLGWKLDAELVTLSACQSGLGKQAGGEGFLGFAQALFLAGARSVMLSLWKVDDTATALLMTRFYQNLLGKRDGLKQPLPKAEALREAKQWLRCLTAADVKRMRDDLRAGRLGSAQGNPQEAAADAERPYAHSHYWAAFILIGDPN